MKTKSPVLRLDRLLVAFAILTMCLAPQLKAQTPNLVTWSFQDTVAPTTNGTGFTLSDFSVSSGSILYQSGNGGQIAYVSSWSTLPDFSTD